MQANDFHILIFRKDEITMLKSIQEYVENHIQQSVDKKLLQESIDDTMKNIAANYFLLGHDVTAKQFLDILINCVKIRLKLAPV